MASTDDYGLDPSFEKIVAILVCRSPKFFSQIGQALDPEGLRSESCQLVLKVAKMIAKEVGHGPSSETVVMQRLKRLNYEGKITNDQQLDVLDLFIEADGMDIPSEKEVLAELVPVVKRRLEGATIRAMIDEHGNKGDISKLAQNLMRISRLGTQESSLGVRLGAGSFAEIQAQRTTNRMPYGIPELDAALKGGLPRGCQSVVIAGSGGGKSMMLDHVAAHCVKQGFFTLLATTELSRAEQLARVKANLTGVLLDTIEEGDMDECEERLEYMFGTLGTLIVEDFAADATTVLDIQHWVKQCSEDEGHKPHVLIIDYADELASHDKNDRNSYESAGRVYSSLRLFAKQEKMWQFTASQPKRKAGTEKNRIIDLDDVADSLKKIRKADQVITINPDKSGDQLSYFVAKHRHGKKGQIIGPLPHEWSKARMIPMLEDGDL